jgi:hypothetical protein
MELVSHCILQDRVSKSSEHLRSLNAMAKAPAITMLLRSASGWQLLTVVHCFPSQYQQLLKLVTFTRKSVVVKSVCGRLDRKTESSSWQSAMC